MSVLFCGHLTQILRAEIFKHLQAGGLAFFRVELDGEDVVFPDGGAVVQSVIRFTRDDAFVFRRDVEGVDKIKVRGGVHAREHRAVRFFLIHGVLREMLDQVGLLELDKDGVAKRGLLVRHLVLPGQLENSKACLKFLAELNPEISVSIMSQYSPQYKACGIPELNRPLTAEEYDEITDYALELGRVNTIAGFRR